MAQTRERTRPVITLSDDANSDVAIVGGGISGVATSYFLLCDTNLSVMLIENGRVARGEREVQLGEDP